MEVWLWFAVVYVTAVKLGYVSGGRCYLWQLRFILVTGRCLVHDVVTLACFCCCCSGGHRRGLSIADKFLKWCLEPFISKAQTFMSSIPARLVRKVHRTANWTAHNLARWTAFTNICGSIHITYLPLFSLSLLAILTPLGSFVRFLFSIVVLCFFFFFLSLFCVSILENK